MQGEQNTKIDCFKCIYFTVTWNPALPKGCRLYGFKSAYMPSITVLNTSGEPCMGFVQKEIKK